MAKKKPSKSGVTGQTLPTLARRVEVVPGDGIPTFYTNSVNIEVSNWDLRFRMAHIRSADEGSVQITEVVRVYMSHSHARAFAAALNGIIAKLDQVDNPSETATSGTKGKPH